MKTGNTTLWVPPDLRLTAPQWSPVMKTGNTWFMTLKNQLNTKPQWSPVMKTGNTRVIAQPSR